MRTTDSTHTDAIASHLLTRNFTVQAQVAFDRVWVSDMTYVPTRSGWLFLATVRISPVGAWWAGLRIPAESGHLFRMNPATHSD